MRARGVRRPAASPASPSSPSWAGAPPRHRGSPPAGPPGSAACRCPRRRRSRTTAGRRPPAAAPTRTAPRSPAPSTTPPSPSLAWVRTAATPPAASELSGRETVLSRRAPLARAVAAGVPGPRAGDARGVLPRGPRGLGRRPGHRPCAVCSREGWVAGEGAARAGRRAARTALPSIAPSASDTWAARGLSARPRPARLPRSLSLPLLPAGTRSPAR